ncbi:hypothetical protein ACFU5E_04625 [Aeromonas bestiarum]|uniref:hypothetical protein n=1 Tax=Aeromonas bestiarum TaxID=105751 RepID=UPI003670E299
MAGQHDLHAEQRAALRRARPVGPALAPQPGRPCTEAAGPARQAQQQIPQQAAHQPGVHP